MNVKTLQVHISLCRKFNIEATVSGLKDYKTLLKKEGFIPYKFLLIKETRQHIQFIERKIKKDGISHLKKNCN